MTAGDGTDHDEVSVEQFNPIAGVRELRFRETAPYAAVLCCIAIAARLKGGPHAYRDRRPSRGTEFRRTPGSIRPRLRQCAVAYLADGTARRPVVGVEFARWRYHHQSFRGRQFRR